MKSKVILVLFGVAVISALALAASAFGATFTSKLVAVGGSGVRGDVLITDTTGGGSFVAVRARRLVPMQEYASFYYDDHACQEDPELVGTFVATGAGVGVTSATIDDGTDEVGSVSVRTPDYSVLFACAALPGGED